MPQPVLTTPPAADILTLEEVRMHAKIDHTEEDLLFKTLISAATAYLDGWAGVLGRCLISQTWRQDFADWPISGKLRLPFPDVQSVTVTYYDSNDAEQTVSASLYELREDSIGSYVRFFDAFTSPSLDDDKEFPVSVSLVAGYGAASSAVPAAIRAAALMMIAHWDKHREAVTIDGTPITVPMTVEALIAPYRRNRL